MTDLTRLDQFIAERRIVRKTWTGTDAQGRETACLLAAISLEVAQAESSSACPAATMWLWLAWLTPWIDDSGSDAAWWPTVERFGRIMHGLSRLDDAAGRRLDYACRAIAVREAVSHTSNAAAVEVCAVVIALCDTEACGEATDPAAWRAAAAEAAARAEAAAAARAARAAERAARVVGWGEARAAERAARVVGWGEARAADRMIDAMLSAMEAEIEKAA